MSVQTPVRQASAMPGKAVRWGDEQAQQRSLVTTSTPSTLGPATASSAFAGPSTPARQSLVRTPSSSYTNAAQLQTPQRPAAPPVVAQTPPAPKPAAASAPASAAASPAPASKLAPTIAPRPSRASLRTRIKWNTAALLILVFLPRFRLAQTVYWSFLDAVYAIFGAGYNETFLGALAWFRWALLIMYLVNDLEAFMQLRFYPTTPAAPESVGLAYPPGYQPVAITPPQRSASARSPSSARYSSGSPLKASLEAASRAAGAKFASSPAQGSPLNPSYSFAGNSLGSSSPAPAGSSPSLMGGSRRLPSAPPANADPSSPLAAYLARRSGASKDFRRSLSGADYLGDGDADLSTESIEVDRALRALSGSYMRSTSAAHTQASPPVALAG